MVNRLAILFALLATGCGADRTAISPARNPAPSNTNDVTPLVRDETRNEMKERMEATQAKEINDPQVKRGRAIPEHEHCVCAHPVENGRIEFALSYPTGDDRERDWKIECSEFAVREVQKLKGRGLETTRMVCVCPQASYYDIHLDQPGTVAIICTPLPTMDQRH